MRLRVALLLGVLWLATWAGAAESGALVADITVRPNGAVRVRETLTAPASVMAGKPALVRSIPVVTRGRYGIRRPIAVRVIGASQNDLALPHRLERTVNFLRVVLAQPGTPPGGSYVLEYEVRGAVERDGLRDALAWPLSSAGWDAPLGTATAVFNLPQGIGKDDITLGCARQRTRPVWSSQGMKPEAVGGASFNISSQTVTFTISYELKPGEELAVVIWVAPGKIAHARLGFGDFATANPMLSIGLLVVLAMLIAYGVLAVLGGRAPAVGRVAPHSELPAVLSPAHVRYLRLMHYDHKCLVAALVEMATEGFIGLHRNGTIFSIQSREDDKKRKGMFTKVFELENGEITQKTQPHEERLVAALLLRASPTFTFASGNCMGIHDVEHQVRESLKARSVRMIRDNRLLQRVGLGLSVLVIVGLGVFDALDGSWRESARVLVGLAMTAAGGYGLASVAWGLWRRAIREPVEQIRHYGSAVFATLALLASIVVGSHLLLHSAVLLLAMVLLLGAMHLIFAHALPVYTREGRKVLDRLEGLRVFLQTGHAPDRQGLARLDLDDFERYLPYALALDVEEAWASHFLSQTRRATALGPFLPAWYDTAEHRPMALTTFVHLLGHELVRAIGDAGVCVASMIEDPV